jgi:hypothetical protein
MTLSTDIAQQLTNLRLLLDHQIGRALDWQAVDEAVKTAKTFEGLSPAKARILRVNHDITDHIVHQDLLPHIEKLRAQAPGRSDSAVAHTLEHKK